MTDRSTDQPEMGIATRDNGAVAVLITFALLFLLSAAVWFVLDRIRVDELRTSTISESRTEHGTAVPHAKVRASNLPAR